MAFLRAVAGCVFKIIAALMRLQKPWSSDIDQEKAFCISYQCNAFVKSSHFLKHDFSFREIMHSFTV